MNPKVVVNLEQLESNVRFLTDKMKQNNLSITAVTKVHNADPQVIKVFEQFPEIEYFGDSRIENLISFCTSSKKKVLIRIPMHSEVGDVVQYADISFNSELSTIKLLDQEAKKQGKMHQVLLMVDLGDLREGFFEEQELMEVVAEVVKMEHIELAGLGVNLTCYGAIIPDEENLGRLIDYKNTIEERFGLKLPMISGGNSSSLYLLDREDVSLPEGITNLRVGEAYLLAGETAFSTPYEEMFQDVFTLRAEIVELKVKPSFPIGTIGVDAFGQSPVFEDQGKRLRGVLGIGRQDIPALDSITPCDDKLEIMGASSDHLIVDFTDTDQAYKVGDEIVFKLDYGSLLASFTSKYVKKEYLK